MIKKIISVIIFLMLATQAYAVMTTTSTAPGPTLPGNMAVDTFVFGGGVPGLRVDAAPNSTGLTFIQAPQVISEEALNILAPMTSLTLNTQIYAELNTLLVKIVDAGDWVVSIHNLQPNDVLVTAVEKADPTNAFATILSDNGGDALSATDVVSIGNGELYLTGQVSQTGNKYPFGTILTVDDLNQEIDATAELRLELTNIAPSTGERFTLGYDLTNDQVLMTGTFEGNSVLGVMLIDASDGSVDDSAYWDYTTASTVNSPKSAVATNLGAPILLWAVSIGPNPGNLEYAAISVSAGSLGLTIDSDVETGAGEITGTYDVEQVSVMNNQDFLILEDVLSGLNQLTALVKVDNTGTVAFSQKLTSSSLNSKADLMNNGDIVIASGKTNVELVTLDSVTGAIINGASMPNNLKSSTGVNSIAIYNDHNFGETAVVGYSTGATPTTDYVDLSSMSLMMREMISWLMSQYKPSIRIGLLAVDAPQGLWTIDNAGYGIQIYNITANPDVPEFSLTTLLLATLLAGGLVLFVVRRKYK